jgi:hypothetical protein
MQKQMNKTSVPDPDDMNKMVMLIKCVVGKSIYIYIYIPIIDLHSLPSAEVYPYSKMKALYLPTLDCMLLYIAWCTNEMLHTYDDALSRMLFS